MKNKLFLLALFLFISCGITTAQDTVQVSLEEFIKTGIQNSGQINAQQQEVLLAKNRINQVQDQRFLPEFSLTTAHGLVPKADDEIIIPGNNNEITDERGAFVDLSDLALYTQAEIQLVQPIFTWGALRNAVKASRSAAEAAASQFEISKNETALRLYKLYQSYLLSVEIDRLLDEAANKLDRVLAELEETESDSASEVDQSDLFQLRVFKSEFAIRAAQVRENTRYVQNIWNYIMGGQNGNTVYMPETFFLDPVENPFKTLSFYKSRALNRRAEILALESGIDAAGYALEATKSKNYPALFFAASGTYIYTPNPPLGSYAFKLNDRNFATAAVGLGIRQNLDFWSMKYDVTRSQIQYQQVQYAKQAAIDGITLQLNEKYKEASVSQITVEKINEALITAKRWLRQEQLDYDLDIGNTKDLIDALQKELELRVQYKQAIFDFNKDMAELFSASAIPVTQLTTNFDENEEIN